MGPPKAAATNSSAAASAAPSGNAAQLAVLPLRELNKRSGQFGAWTVVVQQAQVEEYEYQWEGKQRTGKNLSCLLVSPEDPSEYCIGQMRWTSKADSRFQTVKQKIKDGLAFTMTKVSFINDAKKQYIHSPIQTVVNLAETLMSPLLNSKENACHPEPPATIADCSHLTSHQCFDVTALVKTVGMYRLVKETRIVFDVEIIDGFEIFRNAQIRFVRCRWLCFVISLAWARSLRCGSC